MVDTHYITNDGVAEMLHTSPAVIRQSRCSGFLFSRKGPIYYKVGGRKILYKKQDIIDWVESAPSGTCAV